jgi:hypothetical protein
VLRHRPMVKPEGDQDRAVRRRKNGSHQGNHRRDAPPAGVEEGNAADEAPHRGRRADVREVTGEIDAAHDQLAHEHNRLASEAAMPELPDPLLAREDLSAEDRRALTEMLVDKIVVAPHPHKIVDGKRHYTIHAIPYRDSEGGHAPEGGARGAGQDRPERLT